MGLENFNNGIVDESGNEQVRPRVPSEIHDEVKQFSINAGIDIPSAYAIIISNVLSNTDLYVSVLERHADGEYTFNNHHSMLLDELCDKIKDLERMPSPEEINEANDMHGYPIYISAFTSQESIVDEIENRRPEIYEYIK